MKRGLGDMPLTLFILVTAIILYLYLKRSGLGAKLLQASVGSPASVTIKQSPTFTPPQVANPPLVGQPGGPRIIQIPVNPGVFQ
jgi:hypothetical protein